MNNSPYTYMSLVVFYQLFFYLLTLLIFTKKVVGELSDIKVFEEEGPDLNSRNIHAI